MLRVSEVALGFGNKTVVSNVSFTLAKGELGCLLGPSGCGKTSLLRSIAGFLPVHQGDIQLSNACVASKNTHVPAQQRHVGMVFQDYALFPHLNVADNIAFGLHQYSPNEKNIRVDECLAVIGLESKKDAAIHQLSGGQQQRVALARAMAPKPQLLLLDEPFSSLDVTLRDVLANDIRRIIKEEKMTALLVTHDQKEAFAVADSIGVMATGSLHQWGSASDLYHSPSTRFVAEFIGEGALYECATSKNTFLIRPEHVAIGADGEFAAEIKSRHFRGDHFVFQCQLIENDSSFNSKQLYTCFTPLENNLDVGDTLRLNFDTGQAYAFPAA